MSIATRFVSSTARPRLDLSGCVLYAPLWRPDLGGSTFQSIGDGGIPTHLCTVTGATWGNQGRTFVAANGDGIEITYQAPLNITGAITVLAWVKFTAGSSGVIVGHDNLAGDRVFDLSFGSDKVLAEQFTPYQSLSGDTTLTNNSWVLVGYNDDLTNLRIWLNGVQDGAAAVASTKPSSTENLTIGRKLSAGANFTGTIGEVYIFNRALTVQEHLQVYLGTKRRFQ